MIGINNFEWEKNQSGVAYFPKAKNYPYPVIISVKCYQNYNGRQLIVPENGN